MMSVRRTGIFLLVSLSTVCARVDAQTDTAVADTVVVGAENAGTIKSDSVAAYDAGSDSSAPASDSLLVRTVPDSVVQDWKKAPGFAYANDPRYWQRVREEDDAMPVWLARLLSSNGFRYAIYIILGALLIYAIGRIVSENQLGIFYRGAKRPVGSKEADAAGPEEEEDIDRQLQRSLENKDYRQAVRYSYLRTLRRLDAQGLIHFHGQTTNQEYLRQLGGTDREASFRFLTSAYEKVWYGEFSLSDERFGRLMGYFAEFDKTLPA